MNSNERTIILNTLIEKEYSNIAGVIVIKNDEIAFENYFGGYNQDDTIHVASVTKSIISALIGMAFNKGLIKSLEQNVLDFFPKYKIKRGEKTIQKIVINDLLTMTAPYKFKYEPYTKVYSSDDWSKAVLDLLGGKGKIGEFKYTTVGLQVLSGILTNATGQSVLDFATENLFKPLDIKSPENTTIKDKEEHLAFLKDKHVSSCWVVDPKGVNTAGWGLTLTTKDMAKIGLLYLNMGKWNDKQILSSTWIENSVKEHSKWGEKRYGYLWWIISGKKNEYAAIGDGGNVIFVSPDKKMVIAIASRFMPRAKDRIELIKNHIMPLFDNDEKEKYWC